MNFSEEWAEVRAGDLGQVFTGRTPSTKCPEYFGNEFFFITPGDMHQGKLVHATERKLSDAGANLLRRIQLPPNSVCVSCIGWQMGEVVMTSAKSFTNQQINSIVPNGDVDPDFLYYSFVPRKQELLSLASAIGVRTPILNKSSFCDLRILLPPLEAQRKIASILSAYDDLIENNTRRMKILEDMAQALYREWFVHFRFPGHEKVQMVDSTLGRIPEGWVVKKLGEVIELAYGKALKADNRSSGEVPVYGSGGVVGYHNESLVRGPGIVVGRKGNVGSLFWSDEDFFPIDTVFYVQTELCLHYIYYNLRDQNFINNDAAVPGLNRNQAYLNLILIPNSNIRDMFQDFLIPLFENIRNFKKRIENLRRTRDLLLPKLISGELDVENLKINMGNLNT